MRKYLIDFWNAPYSIVIADSLKNAIIYVAFTGGIELDLLTKSFNGFEETDTSGIVRLYNMIALYKIRKIYTIESVLFDEDVLEERECQQKTN